jgi:hypothetical protein
MERVDANADFKEEGFVNAIVLTKEEIKTLRNRIALLSKIIDLGYETEAIIDQGEGMLILIEGPDGKQNLFPVNELSDALSDLY